LTNLEKFCKRKNFKLFVIPIKYQNPSAMHKDGGKTWPTRATKYFLDTTVRWKDKFKIIGDCNIQATATHPLTGIDKLCEGITTIVGHSVVQMKSLPVNPWNEPIILHSTGSISSKNNYSASKAGYQASFHHCFAAVAIEFDEGSTFHLRQLFADHTGGFYDLDERWDETSNGSKCSVAALVCGDEHVLFSDEKAADATFFDKKSMVNVLKPQVIVRHDVLDSYSVSKWHNNDFFTRFTKNMSSGMNSIEREMRLTLDHLAMTTPRFSKSIIVSSNHHDHVEQWLNSADIRNDYVNAKIYHYLMYTKLQQIEKTGKSQSAFEIFRDTLWESKGICGNIEFSNGSVNIAGIECGLHGHSGPNGARGSIQNLAKIGDKLIIGHSHTPGIQNGCFQVGTLSRMDLEYLTGPSSWLHTNCIIHNNGKRQLVTIINGKWRKS
jgi:hypothetical protein